MIAAAFLLVTAGLVVLAWSCPRFQIERTDERNDLVPKRVPPGHVRIVRRCDRPYDWERES